VGRFYPQQHHRRSIRLQTYDYTQAGAYFVTVVTWRRTYLFGDVVNGEMKLNRAGQVIQEEWLNLAHRFKFVDLGAFVIMSYHSHAILLFHDVGATRPDVSAVVSGETASNREPIDGIGGSPPPPPRGPESGSLGALIGQLKSRATKRLWKIKSLAGIPIWERNYYEHIMRNKKKMSAIWDYIESNPSRWADDDENVQEKSAAGG